MLRLRNRRNHALTERTHALTEMNATKDKFFNIISHDMKNPALLQRDSLKLLLENASVWDIAQIKAYYKELLKSAEGQVDLIYNLLSWSQIQTDRIAYTPAPFMLSELVSGLSLIRNMAESKGITLDVRLPSEAVVTGDINILSTVVRNLLTNAIKFTNRGGTVALIGEMGGNGEIGEIGEIGEAGEIVVSSKFSISVSDTGIGMTDDQIANLFRLDRQRPIKGTAGEQGTGLGLIVCKELLEKHGSALCVESTPDIGSRFWFTL
jgi:signal transduction histidine kinase